MFRDWRVALIIPALDEQDTIGEVLAAVDRALVDQIYVVDNGSADATAAHAREAGARVVHEPRRGYGSACLTGIRAAADADVLVFLDGDGSDDATEIPRLLEALVEPGVGLVIGSRTRGPIEPGALTPIQRFGNELTCLLVRWFWGVAYTDLGPFRALHRDALDRLEMADPDFGWTIEMQVKAAQRGVRTVEIPVSYRNRRGGRSKVSGTLVGSFRAGARILSYVFAALARELAGRQRSG